MTKQNENIHNFEYPMNRGDTDTIYSGPNFLCQISFPKFSLPNFPCQIFQILYILVSPNPCADFAAAVAVKPRRGVGARHGGTRCAPGAHELAAIAPGKCRTGPKCLLACHGDVSPSAADTQNLESLSGLDAGGTASVRPSTASRPVVLTATATRCRGTAATPFYVE